MDNQFHSGKGPGGSEQGPPACRSYSPFGKCHRALSRLCGGKADVYELYEAMGAQTPKARSKCWHALGALLTDRLAWKCGPEYGITSEGYAALQRLSAGERLTFEVEVAPVPSVRVFGRAA